MPSVVGCPACQFTGGLSEVRAHWNAKHQPDMVNGWLVWNGERALPERPAQTRARGAQNSSQSDTGALWGDAGAAWED